MGYIYWVGLIREKLGIFGGGFNIIEQVMLVGIREVEGMRLSRDRSILGFLVGCISCAHG